MRTNTVETLGATRVAKFFLLIALGLGAAACSHLEHRADSPLSPATGAGSGAAGAATVTPAEQAIIKGTPPAAADLDDAGTDLEAIPLEVNRLVFQWIDYFQGRGRPHMERYLSRMTRYAPLMKEILRKEGLPEDLIYIALIESGFSSTAHSSANAVGYWQFIRGTGRRYNLQIDAYVDERRDFIMATQAAANYFKGLYNLFGNWYLAIASYNVGENRVKNLVMKHHTRDFWQLARENKLPDETSNYVPKFLAARLIAKEPEKYGFTDIEYMPALAFNEVEFNSSIDLRKLAQGMNLEYDDLRDLNPSYKKGVAFDKGGKLKLRIPQGAESQALAAAVSAAAGSRKTYVADDDYSYYRVRRGDTIASVAKKFGTSQREIRHLNRLTKVSQLIAGRRIRVPAENIAGLSKPQLSSAAAEVTAVKRMTASKKNSRVSPSPWRQLSQQKEAFKIHIVRRGDTLIEIARRYGVSLGALTAHNQLSRRAKVLVGARLEIPN